ncbi:MAG: hypothetical protein OEZ40_07235 [Candidatus Bathyarchaeota archaeon]|nr:hypothetical protein [Candidatus Bathyarchaeota archaeon]
MVQTKYDLRESLKKALKAFKTVALSLFYMDYQIDSEIQMEDERAERKAKVSKLKLSFVVLTIATIIWMMTFFTLQKYLFVSISLGILLSAGWLGLLVVVAMKKLSKQ